jgi:vacuole morphology and inheritance protein 14
VGGVWNCSIEKFIPLLRERMNVLNPFVRQFLVGWITVLDSVPDIDMLGFLPDFLDGLFNMLSDNSHETRKQADAALSEFLQEIKNAPVLNCSLQEFSLKICKGFRGVIL